MKHLKVLEDNNLVISFEEKSTLGGPPRKSYSSSKRISLRIDVGPNTFNTEIYDYKMVDETNHEVREIEEKDREIENFEQEYAKSHSLDDPSARLTELSKIIQEIDIELGDLKLKRSKLLNLREQMIEESNRIIVELCQEYDVRKILYYLISHQDRNISTISEVMEMREKVIEEIFKNLIKQRILLDLDDHTF